MIVHAGYMPVKHAFTRYLPEKQLVNKFLSPLQSFAVMKDLNKGYYFFFAGLAAVFFGSFFLG